MLTRAATYLWLTKRHAYHFLYKEYFMSMIYQLTPKEVRMRITRSTNFFGA